MFRVRVRVHCVECYQRDAYDYLVVSISATEERRSIFTTTFFTAWARFLKFVYCRSAPTTDFHHVTMAPKRTTAAENKYIVDDQESLDRYLSAMGVECLADSEEWEINSLLFLHFSSTRRYYVVNHWVGTFCNVRSCPVVNPR